MDHTLVVRVRNRDGNLQRGWPPLPWPAAGPSRMTSAKLGPFT